MKMESKRSKQRLYIVSGELTADCYFELLYGLTTDPYQHCNHLHDCDVIKSMVKKLCIMGNKGHSISPSCMMMNIWSSY